MVNQHTLIDLTACVIPFPDWQGLGLGLLDISSGFFHPALHESFGHPAERRVSYRSGVDDVVGGAKVGFLFPERFVVKRQECN